MTRAIGATVASIGLSATIVVAWFALAIAVHAAPTNCGRACYDPGVTENPNITIPHGGD